MTKGKSVPARAITPQTKTVEQMTVEELKAIAYDQWVLFQQIQNNLNILQAELAKRAQK